MSHVIVGGMHKTHLNPGRKHGSSTRSYLRHIVNHNPASSVPDRHFLRACDGHPGLPRLDSGEHQTGIRAVQTVYALASE